MLVSGDRTSGLTAINAEPEEEARPAGLAMIQYALGKKNSSDAALARLIEIAAGDWAYGIASVHAFRAESDRAFAIKSWADNQ